MLFEDPAAEKEDCINRPKHEEDREGDYRVSERFTRKAQKEEQGGDHNHRGKIGENVETRGRGAQRRVDLFHKDHTV